MFREYFNHRLNQRQKENAEFSKKIKKADFYFFEPDFQNDDELWSIQGGKLYNVLLGYKEEAEFIEALTSKDLAIIVGGRASGKSSFINILSRLQEFEDLYIIEIQALSHVPRKLREHAGIVIDLKRDGSGSRPYLNWLEIYKRANQDIVNAYPSALEKGREAIAKRVMERSHYGILFEPSDTKLNEIKDSLTSDIYNTCVGDLVSLLEQDADDEDVWMVIRKIRKLIRERKEVEETIDKIKRLEERHNGKV